MNNKGFAITSIIYGLMLLFVVIVSSFLSILVGRNRRTDELVSGVYESLKYEQINVSKDDFVENDKTAYSSSKRGLYHFDIEGEKCLVYLPKGVVIITGEYKYKELDDTNIKNKLYYNLGGSLTVDDFEEIDCID